MYLFIYLFIVYYKSYEKFTDEEKQTAYQADNGNTKTVRVIKIDPLRRFDNLCMYWMVCKLNTILCHFPQFFHCF